MNVIEIFRVIFGLVFALFLPGFVWSYVFFEKGKIDEIERIALSLGLSIAIVPLLVYLFNRSFDIKITLLNSSITIMGIMCVAGILIWLKR